MTAGKCCPVCKLVGLLVIVGALNWGAVGITGTNVVENLLGGYPMALKVVYIAVGVAGLLKLLMCFKACPCSGGSCGTKK